MTSFRTAFRAACGFTVLSAFALLLAGALCFAADAPSTAGPLLKLLQSGKLPAERQPTVVEMVCARGNANDLAYVFEQVSKSDAYAPKLRRQTLEWLADAAVTRKVKPAGDLSSINKLLADGGAKDAGLQLAGIRLASVWKVAGLSRELQSLAANDKSSVELQQAAIAGLVALGDKPSQAALHTLSESRVPRVRLLATAGLARFDLDRAAGKAASLLAQASATDDLAPLVEAFLNRTGGADKLAAALAEKKLAPDVAKLALRHMYSVGRSDAALSNVLSTAAGIATDPKPPTPEEVSALVAEVAAKGNAARGEKIFRRADLSCYKCHALSRAGGSVGPELSAVGSISPVDYVANSILDPNLAIKEQYVTKIVVTSDGETLTGIVVDRDDVRLNLRDASGKVVSIPTADIEIEKDGRSLMPQGLTKFLTRDELIDLVKFISELGKPGDYAIRKTLSIQRWRVLKAPGQELTAEVPNVEILRQFVLDAPAEAWTTTYGKLAGALPLDELRTGDAPAVVYLQGEVEVSQEGSLAVHIASTEPAQVWVDAEPFDTQRKFETTLSPGRHKITLRVEISARAAPNLKVEFAKPDGSAIEFDVVGGT